MGTIRIQSWRRPKLYQHHTKHIATHLLCQVFANAVKAESGFVYLQVNESVLTQPQLHSLLPLPGITAIPGDRFRELYYWDSYWVIKGLLVSGMTETATSEVRNLLSLLETYGHVPNGARVYYINRRYWALVTCLLACITCETTVM